MNRKTSTTTDAILEDLTFLMQRLRAHAYGMQSAWVNLDLSMAQMKVLVVLTAEGGVTSRALADRLGVGPSAVTQLVDKLEEQKLVRREDDPDDRRVAWIRPTAKAEALHDKLLLAGRSVWLEVLADVPPDELAHVQRGIAVLAGVLRKREAAKEPA